MSVAEAPEAPVAADSAELFRRHAKQHKLTGGQQVNLLLCYLPIWQMFPEISLVQFLERSLRVAGHTKEARDFPKDALDYHCPNKGSVWEPAERVDMMLTLVCMNEILAADGEPAWTLEQFLAAEAPNYKASGTRPVEDTNGDVQPDLPGMPPATAAEAPPKKSRAKKEAAPPPVTSYPLPFRSVYRPTADSPERLGQLVQIFPEEANKYGGFIADSGECFRVVAELCLPSDVPLPVFPQPDVSRKLMLAKDENARAESLLGSPGPVGNVGMGEALQSWPADFGEELGRAVISIVNGTPKPYVDTYFVDKNNEILGDLPPRDISVTGYYRFLIGGKNLLLEIQHH